MRKTLVLGLALAGLAAAAPAAFAYSPSVPSDRQLSVDGPGRRYLLDGDWLVRRDPRDSGLRRHWERASSAGWSTVSIPNAWNATGDDYTSFTGMPVWYRKDFTVPDSAAGLSWLVRFEAVNYRATVWLNGVRIGGHAGAFLPFELPLSAINRTGVNHLVVRVDNRRLPTDFPPSSFAKSDEPHGGWWNYGGIVREVYVRAVDRVDFARVIVTPKLTCNTCPAQVGLRVRVRNVTTTPQRVHLDATVGPPDASVPAQFADVTLAPGRTGSLTGTATIATPHLWWPSDPYLYPVAITASAAAGADALTPAGTYAVETGLRSVTVGPDGHLLLNGAPLNARGVALHDDMPGHGAALSTADQDELMREVKDSGATLVRAHYPLNPYFEQLADRQGVLLWSEVPVYQLKTHYLRSVIPAAVNEVRTNVADNANHPSIIVWSIGNELDDTLPADVRRYIASAAAAARALDPSRPVGMATQGHPRRACLAGYEPLQVLGINDYFGWYKSTPNRLGLGPYLDKMHGCHPRQAMLVTEIGAEANRDGAVTEKGTYQFQQDFVRYQFATVASKSYLSGAIYWTLREFRCRPGWDGGNPKPTPPLHQKAVLHYDGTPKPAYADLQAIFRATDQVPGQPPPPGNPAAPPSP